MFAKKSISCIFSVLFVIVLILTGTPLQAARAAGECYVKWNAGGANTGASWTDAYTDLQSALGASPCTEVWVAAGTYKPTTGADRTITFQLKNGVALYGGFAGTEGNRADRNPVLHVTILSGDLLGNDNSNVQYDEPTRADNSYHVVTGATGATLDGFTVTAGNANVDTWPIALGGGMFNDSSSPTLTNVTFSGNSAEDSGGGMFNYDISNPTLTNVTFSGNSATDGGGIMNNNSNPTLTNVTFSNNSASNGGGGMENYYSSPTLTNVTFSGNSATSNGGGMYNYYQNSSNPIIRNTIFWGNTAASGAQISNDSGNVPIVSSSVIQGGYTGGTHIITANPMLGTLGDYGGSTQTIPLLAGSSAIDATSTNCPAADQRGMARPQGASCDIGAFEAIPQTLVVNSVANTDDGMCNTTNCTLREAINAGNAGLPGMVYTISFNVGFIRLGSPLPAVNGNLAIQGSGADYLTISGNNLYRVLTVNSGASLSLSGVTISSGNVSGFGGGIENAGGTLSVTDCIFSNNSAPSGGGAIHNGGGGSLTITRVTFSSNHSSYGGAINSGEGSLGITDSTFNSNTATVGGGAIDNYHSTGHTATITDSTFSGNSAVHGGAIINDDIGILNITNSTFSANTASTDGGGMNNHIGTTNLTNSTFSGNDSANGGSLSNSEGGTLNVTNSTFSSSGASASGTLRNYAGTVTLRNSILARDGGTSCSNSGTLNADTYNLASDTSCASATQTSLANLHLGPLQDNGGLTQTMALLPGSVAIGAGDDTVCAAGVGAPNYGAGGIDQRGVVRPHGVHCDVGAFEAQQLELLLPLNGATLHYNRPTFDWTDFPSATGYQIQVSKNSTFTRLVVNTNTSAANSTYTPTSNLPANTLLYWRVRAKLGTAKSAWSSAWTLHTGTPPSIPSPLAPADNALTRDLTPLLGWTQSTSANFDHYQIQLADNPDFTGAVDVDIAGVANHAYTPTVALNTNTKYYWHVRSWNTTGDYSAWSALRTFRESMLPPGLIAPIGGITVGDRKPVFDWDDVTGATKYTLQVSLNSAFSSLVLNLNVTPSTYTPVVNLAANKLFHWRVRAIGPNGPSAWSVVETFHTP